MDFSTWLARQRSRPTCPNAQRNPNQKATLEKYLMCVVYCASYDVPTYIRKLAQWRGFQSVWTDESWNDRPDGCRISAPCQGDLFQSKLIQGIFVFHLHIYEGDADADGDNIVYASRFRFPRMQSNAIGIGKCTYLGTSWVIREQEINCYLLLVSTLVMNGCPLGVKLIVLGTVGVICQLKGLVSWGNRRKIKWWKQMSFDVDRADFAIFLNVIKSWELHVNGIRISRCVS